MSQSTKTAIAAAVVIIFAGAFWLLLLVPKRDQASELSEQVASLRSDVAAENSRAAEGLAAKREFPDLYRQMVIQGKAVPGDAATPSLLVQLNGVSRRADTSFKGIQLNGGAVETAPVVSTESTIPATPSESAAALLPLGAAVGPAGFAAMPYSLQFNGGFFGIANFIQGLDALVETKDGQVDPNGRLITIDGFELKPEDEESTKSLTANFNVTTYVTPPGQGITAGATSVGPETSTTPNLP